MQIRYALIKVENQDKALEFYTKTLGFQKGEDHAVGPRRWLTVKSPEGPAGVELVLESNDFPAARSAQKTLFEAGFPATVLTTVDLDADYQRLLSIGVRFRGEPKTFGPISFAQFEDDCGNLINLVQPSTQGIEPMKRHHIWGAWGK